MASVIDRIRGVYYGWWIVVSATTLGAFSGAVYFFGFSAFFLSLEEEFDSGFGKVALIAGLGNVINGGLVAPLLGPLIDRYGPRRFMFLGVALMGLGFVLLSTATSMTQVFVYFLAFISVGVGMGAMVPPTMALPKWFIRKRGTVFGIHNTGLGIGAVLVIATGLLIEALGWKGAALAIGIAAWALGFPMAAIVKSRPEQYGLLPDGGSAHEKSTAGEHIPEVELTAREALATRAFWLQYASFTLRMMVSIGTIIHFVPAVVETGVSQTAAVGYFSLFGIMSLPSRFFAGTLGDRFNKRLVFMAATGIMGLASITLASADAAWQIVLFAVLFATGSGGSGTVMNPISADTFGRASFATIAGYGAIITMVGTFAGPVLAGFVYDATNGYAPTMYTFAGLTAASIGLIALARRPVSKAVAAS